MAQCSRPCLRGVGRRGVLATGLVVAPALLRPAFADDPAALPPQPGDRFAHLTGPRKGQVVADGDLPLGGPQVQAYPIDIKSGLVRDQSRLNLVILARFDPATLSAETRARAADGVVAYSGVCTHQGCAVNMWVTSKSALYCSCHGSTYDPRDGAAVIAGPAPRSLPSLALATADEAPFVTGGFSGHVGPTQQ